MEMTASTYELVKELDNFSHTLSDSDRVWNKCRRTVRVDYELVRDLAQSLPAPEGGNHSQNVVSPPLM